MPKVLFGVKPDWNAAIAETLAGSEFDVSVGHLDLADLSLHDAVVPLRLKHYEELRRAKRQTRNYLIPSDELISLCDDKRAFGDLLVASGFEDYVPRPRAPGGPFPYIFKPRRSSWGEGCRLIRNEDDEARIDQCIEGFAQECIGGQDEYAVHTLSKEGVVLYMCVVKHRMSGCMDINGADCTPLQSDRIENPPLFSSVISAVIRSLAFNGIGCFDVKMQDGLPKILEMNPRFGGSLCRFVHRLLFEYVAAVR